MDKIKEKSLIDCLSHLNLKDLPKEWDNENVYILAVGLVSKRDGSSNYVALKKDKDGNDKIAKDFGNIALLNKIEKVYPYRYLDERYVPTFKTKTKEERIEWLKQMGSKDDLSELSVKELNKKVLNMSMQIALRNLNRK